MSLSRTQKPRNFFFSWKAIIRWAGLLILLTTLAMWLDDFKQVRYFPITSVQVTGANYSDHEEVQALLLPLVHSGFFGVDVHEMKERLLSLAWVNDVAVSRHWPNQIFITITEKMPIARWNDKSLLNRSGELFTPPLASYPSDLPHFIGSEGDELEMIDYYQKINNALSVLHFKITELELTPFHYWKLTLDNGMKMSMGHKDVLTRIDHFVKVYPKIVGTRASEVEYVDLRYSNGFAVRWKSII